MARIKAENPVMQSLWDRLTDREDWPTTRNQSLAMYREGIKRDVEWLLNARKPFIPNIDHYKQSTNSVMNYGLPDLSQFNGANANSDALTLAILNTMRTFEPRVIDPRVQLQRTDVLSRSIRFHVDGRLIFENSEEDISFDTVLSVTSGEYEVN